MFKKYDVETIYFIDLILSTIFVLFFLFMFGNTKNISKNTQKFTLKDWGIITGTALVLSSTLILGGKILENNNISYLTLLDTGIDVFASILVAYLFYNEELTAKKIIGLILIMTGVFIIH
jgi:drug/metabolite transporter (DMT)-like permease